MSKCESKELVRKIWEYATSKSVCMALLKSSGEIICSQLLHCANADLHVNGETGSFTLQTPVTGIGQGMKGSGAKQKERGCTVLFCGPSNL